jgi:hypothetical protein
MVIVTWFGSMECEKQTNKQTNIVNFLRLGVAGDIYCYFDR